MTNTLTAEQTIALLNQVLDETAKELGCENDNEAILQAIHDLKQCVSLPSPPVSGEAVTDPDSIFYGASIEEAIETGTWFWQLGRGPMSVSQGGFASFDDAKADLRRLLTGSTEKTRLVNKEWFERMVKLEDPLPTSRGHSFGDWRDIRACLEALVVDYMSLPDDTRDALWKFAEALPKVHPAMTFNCAECGKTFSRIDQYRCADCHATCCENCIRPHFGPEHKPHPSPLTNEPVGVTKPKCGMAGEISLPAMGLDYFYNPSDWEWTQNADDDSCIADWLSESQMDVMEIQTLIEGPLLFAANIPTKWDEDGEVTDSEITYFDTEEDARRALSAAIGERG